MKALLELSEERVKVYIERQQKLITAMQADLDKEHPAFIALEQDYFAWKKKIDAQLVAIRVEKNELDQLQHFDKFKHQPKPALIQQQVVKQKKKFLDSDIVPLPVIKWETVIKPALIELNHFINRQSLWKYLVVNLRVEDTSINKKRFDVACASKVNSWYTHNPTGERGGMIGLREWDLSKHLNDFYKTA